MNQLIVSRYKTLGLKTAGQIQYIQTMQTKPITIGVGPAGTGKTFLAVAYALSQLNEGKVNKILLTRPAVAAGEELGHLPGDLEQKVEPYLLPLFDAMQHLTGSKELKSMIGGKIVEIAPLAFLRGRTFNGTMMILDEAQNTLPSQMMMYLTRMGRESKCVVCGDVSQRDLPKHLPSGLDDAIQRLGSCKSVGVAKLTKADIRRHPAIEEVISAYEYTGQLPTIEDVLNDNPGTVRISV